MEGDLGIYASDAISWSLCTIRMMLVVGTGTEMKYVQ